MVQTQRATAPASSRLRRALAPVSSNQLDPRRCSSKSSSKGNLKRSLLPLLGNSNGSNRKVCDSSLTPANTQSRTAHAFNKPTSASSKRNAKHNVQEDGSPTKTASSSPQAEADKIQTISISSSLVFRSEPHQHITHTSIELQLGHSLKSSSSSDYNSYLVNTSYEYNECDGSFEVKKKTTFLLDHDLSMEVDKRNGFVVENEGMDYYLMWDKMLDENTDEDDATLDSNSMLDEKNENGNEEDDLPKKNNNEDDEFINTPANKFDCWKSSNDEDKENEPPVTNHHYTRENLLTNQHHEDADENAYTAAVFRQQQSSQYHTVDADVSHDSIELQLHLGHPINDSYCTNDSVGESSQHCNDTEQYAVNNIEVEEGDDDDDDSDTILNSNHHEGFVRIHNSRVMSGVQFLQLRQGADLSMEVEKDIVENGEHVLEWMGKQEW